MIRRRLSSRSVDSQEKEEVTEGSVCLGSEIGTSKMKFHTLMRTSPCVSPAFPFCRMFHTIHDAAHGARMRQSGLRCAALKRRVNLLQMSDWRTLYTLVCFAFIKPRVDLL